MASAASIIDTSKSNIFFLILLILLLLLITISHDASFQNPTGTVDAATYVRVTLLLCTRINDTSGHNILLSSSSFINI